MNTLDKLYRGNIRRSLYKYALWFYSINSIFILNFLKSGAWLSMIIHLIYVKIFINKSNNYYLCEIWFVKLYLLFGEYSNFCTEALKIPIWTGNGQWWLSIGKSVNAHVLGIYTYYWGRVPLTSQFCLFKGDTPQWLCWLVLRKNSLKMLIGDEKLSQTPERF